jgi:aminoglycoside phosphotransferase family enzyme
MRTKWRDPWLELQKKVSFLRDPSSYPVKTKTVECIETHMSWVFITETEAFKLKKPVHFPFLNLEEIEDRKINSEKEVSINQKLSPGLYRKAIPLVKKNDSFEIINEVHDEEVADWLVWMKVMPREFTLDQEIKNNCVDMKLVHQAANTLVEFYKKSPSFKISTDDYKLHLETCIKENFKILSRHKYCLDLKLISYIHEEQLNFLYSSSRIFDRRVLEGRIIEAHGDLRPEHICLTNPPLLIDRLEFNERMRMLDPLDELSYLSLECHLLGRPDIGELFLNIYQEMTNDKIDRSLVLFYKSYRATLRARISALHYDDRRILNKKYYLIKASQYLNLGKIVLERRGDTDEGVPLMNFPPASVSGPSQIMG